jgi:hypothetical protein
MKSILSAGSKRILLWFSSLMVEHEAPEANELMLCNWSINRHFNRGPVTPKHEVHSRGSCSCGCHNPLSTSLPLAGPTTSTLSLGTSDRSDQGDHHERG